MADVYLNAASPLSFHAFVQYCQRLKTDDTVYPSKSGKFVFRDMYDVIICGPKEESTVRYPVRGAQALERPGAESSSCLKRGCDLPQGK